MVRGYQKRVIHLKNTESDAFDEAFFLVSRTRGEKMDDSELIKEANRIIEQSTSGKRERGFFSLMRAAILPFLVGAAFSSILWILLTIV